MIRRFSNPYLVLSAIVLVSGGAALVSGTSTDWPNYGNDSGRMRYSPLTQINTRTVKQLTMAWKYNVPGPLSGNESTPIMVDGLLFTATPNPAVIALDPVTGKEQWSFDPNGPGVPTFC